MWLLFAVLATLSFGAFNLILKHTSGNREHYPVVLLGLYGTGTVTSLAFGGWGFSLDVVILGLVSGLFSLAGDVFLLRAYDQGPISLISPIVSSNAVIVVGVSILLYGESLSMIQAAGAGLLILAIFLIRFQPGVPVGNIYRWFPWALSCFACFGIANLVYKIAGELGTPLYPIVFLNHAGVLPIIIAFLIGARKEIKFPGIPLQQGALAGVFSALALVSMGLAMQTGPASIVSPIVALNSVVVVIGAICFFGERLNRFQVAALGVLVGGILLIRWPWAG